MPLVRYSSAVVQNSPFVPVLTKSVSLFPFRLVSLDTQETYHVKVVKPGPLPQPLEHECRSTQFPARPQSEANSTVVGQKPQRLRSRSTRHSKPPLAVRSLVGSPEEKTVANLVIRGSRFWTWAGAVPDAGVGATTADSTRPVRRRGRKRRGNIPCLDYLERAVKLFLDEGNQGGYQHGGTAFSRQKLQDSTATIVGPLLSTFSSLFRSPPSIDHEIGQRAMPRLHLGPHPDDRQRLFFS